MTVEQLLTGLSSWEIVEWKAYLKIKNENTERDMKRQQMQARVKSRAKGKR